MKDLFEDSGAVFSPCGLYRYRLWRRWDSSAPAVFLMLNPSTADDIENDPTVERCERRARSMGFGGLEVINLFALRSTDRSALYTHPAPIGPENDSAILAAVYGAGKIICAWGTDGRLQGRDQQVLSLLRGVGIPLYFLRLNKDGTPQHPLYIGYSEEPKLWQSERN